MEGWDVFMKDHGINSNHSGASGYSSLVFSYAGNSTFKVLVLDCIGCVRESAYFSTNSAGLLGECSSSLHAWPTQWQQQRYYNHKDNSRSYGLVRLE